MSQLPESMRTLAALVLATLAAAGCETLPAPSSAPTDSPSTSGELLDTFASRAEQQAAQLEAQGRLHEALMVLKAVQNFQPDRGIQQKVSALQTQINTTVSSLLSAADRHKKRGNLRARRTALQKVLVLSPSHPNALAGLRELTSEEAHAAQNSKAQAEQTAAAKSASASVLGQIQSLIEGGQYRAALSQLGEPSATQSQSAAHTQLQYSALMGLAAEAEQKQQSDEAWQLYARASALNGINTAAAATKSQSLGDVLSKEHQAAGERALRTDPGSAVDHFQAALRYNPNNNRARRGLGQAQRMRDRLEQLRNR